MRVSSEEESTDLPFIANGSKRPNTSKPTGRRNVFRKIRIVKVCRLTKTTRAPCRGPPGCTRRPCSSSTNIGRCTVLNEENEARAQHRCTVVVQDHYSYWFQRYPPKNDTAQETMICLQKLVPPGQKPGTMHRDNSPTFIRACEDLCWNHNKPTPHRSETHGIAGNRSP